MQIYCCFQLKKYQHHSFYYNLSKLTKFNKREEQNDLNYLRCSIIQESSISIYLCFSIKHDTMTKCIIINVIQLNLMESRLN